MNDGLCFETASAEVFNDGVFIAEGNDIMDDYSDDTIVTGTSPLQLATRKSGPSWTGNATLRTQAIAAQGWRGGNDNGDGVVSVRVVVDGPKHRLKISWSGKGGPSWSPPSWPEFSGPPHESRRPKPEPDRKPGMQIFVTSMGKTVTVNVEPTDTIEEVSAKVNAEAFGPEYDPKMTHRLVCNGRMLEEGRTLADYNIAKLATLRGILSMRQ